MKAVQELVSYFDRQGKISQRRLRRLLDQGFLAADAPENMLGLCDTVGTSFYFRVRGEAGKPLWGTDIYTADSWLATAAIHAGLVKPDQTAFIKVTAVTPPAQYQGSERNAVISHDFGRYGTAYRLSAV
jgi:hypothetical protein